MSEFIYIYIYTVLQNIESFLCFMYFIWLVIFIAAVVNDEDRARCSLDNDEGVANDLINIAKSKFFAFFFAALCLLMAFLPSKEDVKTIIAGGIAWKAGQNVSEVDGISELPENIVNAMNSFLIGIEEGSKKE